MLRLGLVAIVGLTGEEGIELVHTQAGYTDGGDVYLRPGGYTRLGRVRCVRASAVIQRRKLGPLY